MKAFRRFMDSPCRIVCARSFIVSIVTRSYVLFWGRRQHTSTCERGVPSVGCTSPRAAASDSMKGLRRQGGQIEPPNVTRFAGARQLFEPRLLCSVVSRSRAARLLGKASPWMLHVELASAEPKKTRPEARSSVCSVRAEQRGIQASAEMTWPELPPYRAAWRGP